MGVKNEVQERTDPHRRICESGAQKNVRRCVALGGNPKESRNKYRCRLGKDPSVSQTTHRQLLLLDRTSSLSSGFDGLAFFSTEKYKSFRFRPITVLQCIEVDAGCIPVGIPNDRIRAGVKRFIHRYCDRSAEHICDAKGNVMGAS